MRANLSPHEVMVVEDSHIGRKAALLSGAHLCPVENPENVTLKKITMRIEQMYSKLTTSNTSQRVVADIAELEKISVIVPMGSSYEEFAATGYPYYGPLAEVGNQPLIKLVPH
jgi:hypothetical protein